MHSHHLIYYYMVAVGEMKPHQISINRVLLKANIERKDFRGQEESKY